MPLFRHGYLFMDGPDSYLGATTRQDISDVLLSALLPMPPGYNLHPRNRHDRRRNRVLTRDWFAAIPIVPIGKEVG